jgi:hypothetical protein
MPLNQDRRRTLLETEALVLGYAMSRLDKAYLAGRHLSTWKDAFAEAARSLHVPSASLKNLRDEFDPLHDNDRKGWHGRALRPSRHRVVEQLRDVDADALIELANRILARDEEAIAPAIDSLADVDRVAGAVAARLLTGRLAEEFFLANSEEIVGVPATQLDDHRLGACGFDFRERRQTERVIEVKGMRELRGDILFTDREWSEARTRRDNYWLVVIGRVRETPKARLIKDPREQLVAKGRFQSRISIIWQSRVSV